MNLLSRSVINYIYYLHLICRYQSLIAVIIWDLEMCYLPLPDSGHVRQMACSMPLCLPVIIAQNISEKIGMPLDHKYKGVFIGFQWYKVGIRDSLDVII